MMVYSDGVRTKPGLWCAVAVFMMAVLVEVTALNGPNVCMVQQKYNITRRVKYRAPMSVRTYEWCFSMPPRCSKWNTEMRDLTRLETEERTAEVAVCCPGYKMMDVSCVPICPNGKTGPGCSEDCPDNKWGPNCIHDCKKCKNGFCSPITGECDCLEGWQGESCDSMPIITSTTTLEELTTYTTKITSPNTPRATTPSSTTTAVEITTPRVILTSKSTVPITRSTTTSTIRTPSTKTPTTVKAINEITSIITPTEPTRVFKALEHINIAEATETSLTTISPNNIELTTTGNAYTLKPTEKVTQKIVIKTTNDKTPPPMETTRKSTEAIKLNEPIKVNQKPFNAITTTEMAQPSTLPTIKETIVFTETTKKETTLKVHPTTVKFKPKEIWIRPAQKGESSIIETKIKPTYDFPRYRSANKDITPANTTPKTIIVSIIPTSVSYSTFKKIALTTATYVSPKNITKAYDKIEHEFTKPMPVTTFTPPTMTSRTHSSSTLPTKNISTVAITSPVTYVTPKPSTTVTKPAVTSPKNAILATKSTEIVPTVTIINKTNSMYDMTTSTILISSTNSRTLNNNTTTKSSNLPIQSTTEKMKHAVTHTLNNQTAATVLKPKEKHTVLLTPKVKDTVVNKEKNIKDKAVLTHIVKATTVAPKDKAYHKVTGKDFKKTNVTKHLTTTSTVEPDDEEFHILTEPEHITAVMGDKGGDRTSVDLVSVISIAGGVMMAVITVAVIIVMMERCKKPRYDDVRKMNDIRMQVMIDNDDVPPPYVRSIFHTPLPEPPSLEKCHYQPISTLDRNLKQFMRPVVVQTISPIMLENFREILECHYDHLPRRQSHDFGTMQTRCSVAPSLNDCNELRYLRGSVTESTIEALKCEAKLDVIDNSEPLYAEIPCWRPPSEHAIEIMNINGEAVTEL